MTTKISIDAGPRDKFAQNIAPVVEAVITKAVELCAQRAEIRADGYALNGCYFHARILRKFADELRELRLEQVASK